VDSPRRELVRTDAGRLYLDPEPAAGDDFDVLARNATRMLVDPGLLVPVAAIDDLMRIRRWRGRPEDRRTLDVLGTLRGEIDARRVVPASLDREAPPTVPYRAADERV
jgi:hypothetical protein